MKRIYSVFISVIAFIFLFSCGELEDDEIIISKSEFIGNSNEMDNLLEKHDISTRSDWFIWNDYMPGDQPYSGRSSIFTVSFDSPNKLPQMDVFATIITERITIPVLLYDIYDGKGTYGLLYRKDFRPKKGIRLNDGEKYNLEIIVKIHEEHQILIFEDLEVYVTH